MNFRQVLLVLPLKNLEIEPETKLNLHHDILLRDLYFCIFTLSRKKRADSER